MEPRPVSHDAAPDPVAQPDHHAATVEPIPGSPAEPHEAVRHAHPWRRRLLSLQVLGAKDNKAPEHYLSPGRSSPYARNDRDQGRPRTAGGYHAGSVIRTHVDRSSA